MRRWMLIAVCALCVGGALAVAADPKQPEEEKEKVIAAKVYAIDEKLDIVMIDAGSDQGVEPLMYFMIARPDGVVGYIQISTVTETAAGGLIDRDRTWKVIAVGDKALGPAKKDDKKKE